MTPERWHQIEALYHATRERPLAERASFLTAACSGDDALRREVESLLQEPVSEEGFFDRSALARATEMISPVAPVDMSGRTMGVYQLQSLLGAGGMGEVYRAHDAKLRRDVAIKILSREFTADHDRLTRFEREARMLAALNHPNICAIYGLEESEGTRFLILELVEGETLADKLAAVSRSPSGGAGLPFSITFPIARQIAEALKVAHDKGIVHRDLKPANIKITPDGVIKVLDFGLAKTAADEDAAIHPAHAPTMIQHGTQDGVIVGTPAYMSPEQARAKPIDKRTDIWSFGCVLYELLTGRVAFAGDTAVGTIARILEREPDWSALPAKTPEPIRALLRGCLTKDPQTRVRDIGAVQKTIDDILAESSRRAGTRLRWLPWLVAAAVIGLAGLALWILMPSPQASLSTFSMPAGTELASGGGAHMIAVSPNGTRMAYVVRPNLLYLRVMDDPAKPVPDTQLSMGVREPVFSPDGLSIAFFADLTIKVIPIAGGDAKTICKADTPFGMNWGPDGIVYGQGKKGVWLVQPEPHSEPRQIASVRDDQLAHGPQILPGGQHVLFTVASGESHSRWNQAEIVVQPFNREEERKSLITGSDGRYLEATGQLFYAISGQLFAVPYDGRFGVAVGKQMAIVNGISRATGASSGAAEYSFSTTGNGVFAYVPGPVLDSESAPTDIATLDLTGGGDPQPLQLPRGAYAMPRVSLDGRRLAYVNDDEPDNARQIWIRDLQGTGSAKLKNGGNNRFVAWMRDNKRIAFQSDYNGKRGMFLQAADGSGSPIRLGKEPARDEFYEPESWSPTVDTLVFSKSRNGDFSLWTYSLADRREAPFGGVHSSVPTCATFSRDGKWVAYTIRKKGEMTTQIEVQPFPATGTRTLIAARGSDSPKQPRWWPGIDRLIYNPGGRPGAFVSIGFTTAPEFSFIDADVRVLAHRFQGAPATGRTPYDVTSDGKLVGMITWGQLDYAHSPLDQIHVLTNWFEALKGRVPPR